MKLFAELLSSTLKVEMQLHRDYCQRLGIGCVRQVQQKDLRCAGSSKAAGAERSLWRELSAAPGGGLGSLPHHEFFVFA
jgi:hypothetical protein